MKLNNKLIARLFAGEFDPPAKRNQTAFKKLVARQCSKPNSRLRSRVAPELPF